MSFQFIYSIGGKPLAFYLGFLLLGLVTLQFITAKTRLIKNRSVHKINGTIIFIVVVIHAVSAILLYV